MDLLIGVIGTETKFSSSVVGDRSVLSASTTYVGAHLRGSVAPVVGRQLTAASLQYRDGGGGGLNAIAACPALRGVLHIEVYTGLGTGTVCAGSGNLVPVVIY